MAAPQAEFLRLRAEKFLANGRDLLEKGVFDLAAFSLEQYCQLILKYYLFKILGDFPKTHFLRELFYELGKAAKKKAAVGEFLEANIDVVANLENAYITSRYLPAIFMEKEVKNMLDFCQKLKNFLGKL